MTKELVKSESSLATIEQILIGGDLSRLNVEERVVYYNKVCETLGLNPLTRPFDYITLNGKLVLYANKGCAEQLRSIHKVSLFIAAREMIEGVCVVTAQAKLPDGREDGATGAVSVKGLTGEALANAFMKAETKAKRRATLSICGLNMLDETEVESIHVAHSQGSPLVRPAYVPPSGPSPVTSSVFLPPAPKAEPTKIRSRGSVGAEILALSSELKLSQDELSQWALEHSKVSKENMTLLQLEAFLAVLQHEQGLRGDAV